MTKNIFLDQKTRILSCLNSLIFGQRDLFFPFHLHMDSSIWIRWMCQKNVEFEEFLILLKKIYPNKTSILKKAKWICHCRWTIQVANEAIILRKNFIFEAWRRHKFLSLSSTNNQCSISARSLLLKKNENENTFGWHFGESQRKMGPDLPNKIGSKAFRKVFPWFYWKCFSHNMAQAYFPYLFRSMFGAFCLIWISSSVRLKPIGNSKQWRIVPVLFLASFFPPALLFHLFTNVTNSPISMLNASKIVVIVVFLLFFCCCFSFNPIIQHFLGSFQIESNKICIYFFSFFIHNQNSNSKMEKRNENIVWIWMKCQMQEKGTIIWR